jgi:uncharacterized protein YkwD
MSKTQAAVISVVLFVIALIGVPSCSSASSQQENERLNNELSEAKEQIAALQSQLASSNVTQGQYQELNANYNFLQKQYDAKVSDLEIEKSLNDDLTAEYEDLKKQYDALVAGQAGISEEEVEQAIFELINQERKNNGLGELTWGPNLNTWAKLNSRHMKEDMKYEYSEYSSFREVFWAAGYSTVDEIASGALLTWKVNTYQYELNIISPAKYGAVGAYKSGDIIFITYMADVFK